MDSEGYAEKKELFFEIKKFLIKTFKHEEYMELCTYSQDEYILGINYPFAAQKVYKAKGMAEMYTNLIFGQNATNSDGTIANAFKHAYWNALMCKYIGYDLAERFSTAHEAITQTLDTEYLGFTEKIHSDMDLYYNNFGRQHVKPVINKSEKEIAKYIYLALSFDESHVLIKSSIPHNYNLAWYEQGE